MPVVVCRDCGGMSDEDDDDPAPCLCPDCYTKRLEKIGPLFSQMSDSLDNTALLAMWLEEALIDIGGETPAWAHVHAATLYEAMLMVDKIAAES